MKLLRNTRKHFIRHPRVAVSVLAFFTAGALALVFCGHLPSGNVSADEANTPSPESKENLARAARDEILEHVRTTESLSASDMAVVQEELDTALGDGKLHVQTAMHEAGLTESVSDFLAEKKMAADDVLIWSGYLGLLGESWGALLKTPEGVEIVTFAEDLSSQNLSLQDSASLGESQTALHTVQTIEVRAALYQSDWT